jgi:hypothetical protein
MFALDCYVLPRRKSGIETKHSLIKETTAHQEEEPRWGAAQHYNPFSNKFWTNIVMHKLLIRFRRINLPTCVHILKVKNLEFCVNEDVAPHYHLAYSRNPLDARCVRRFGDGLRNGPLDRGRRFMLDCGASMYLGEGVRGSLFSTFPVECG